MKSLNRALDAIDRIKRITQSFCRHWPSDIVGVSREQSNSQPTASSGIVEDTHFYRQREKEGECGERERERVE